MILGDLMNDSGRTVVEAAGLGLLSWILRKLSSLDRRLVRIETKLGVESVNADE
jgi:hypothetical protein